MLPTFGTFVREAAGRYVAMDGRFWRTMAFLVARPGYLTLEYLRGRRKRYIRPSRLFLVLYLVLFAAIGLVQSPGRLSDEVVFVDGKAASGQAAPASEGAAGPPGAASEANAPAPSVAPDPLDHDLGIFGVDKDMNLTLRVRDANIRMPDQVRKRWDQFKKLSQEEKAERIYGGILRYGPYAMAALLPAFALLLKLAYLGRGRAWPQRPQRYAEHLVYSAHLHAFAAVMLLALLLLPAGVLHYAIAAWIAYYAMRARHVVYGGRWWAGLLRACLVGSTYLVLLGMAMAALVVMAIMLR